MKFVGVSITALQNNIRVCFSFFFPHNDSLKSKRTFFCMPIGKNITHRQCFVTETLEKLFTSSEDKFHDINKNFIHAVSTLYNR